MSTTKEVKALLAELRRQLDPDQAAHLEPILRSILDAAKPKTIVEVEYRNDPNDKAEIESLRATVRSQDESIRQLKSKLANPPELFDHMTFEELLKEIDNKARAWCDCASKCMQAARHNEGHLRKRKAILERWLDCRSWGWATI